MPSDITNPVAIPFGVLTCDSLAQALERAGEPRAARARKRWLRRSSWCDPSGAQEQGAQLTGAFEGALAVDPVEAQQLAGGALRDVPEV